MCTTLCSIIRYDIIIGNDITRGIHCDVIMSNVIAVCTYHAITVHRGIAMSFFCCRSRTNCDIAHEISQHRNNSYDLHRVIILSLILVALYMCLVFVWLAPCTLYVMSVVLSNHFEWSTAPLTLRLEGYCAPHLCQQCPSQLPPQQSFSPLDYHRQCAPFPHNSANSASLS